MSGTSITFAEPQSDIANLVFYGVDGTECEEFVVSIRRVAFTEGKARDGDWMLDLATICLRGKALRWHASLERPIKHDWDLFVQALFEEYPMSSESSSLLPASPAVRSFSTSATPSSLVSATGGPQIGKLRLVGANFPGTDYLWSKVTISKYSHEVQIAHKRITLGPEEADAVRLIQFDRCIGLYLSVSELWLGIVWDDKTGVGVVSADSALTESPAPFTVIEYDRCPLYSTSLRDFASQVWRIDANRTLSVTCNLLSTPDSPPLWMTTVAVHMLDKTIYFVKDFEDFVKKEPHLYYKARMVFEPMSF